MIPEHFHALRGTLWDLARQASEQAADYRKQADSAQRRDMMITAAELRGKAEWYAGKEAGYEFAAEQIERLLKENNCQ